MRRLGLLGALGVAALAPTAGADDAPKQAPPPPLLPAPPNDALRAEVARLGGGHRRSEGVAREGAAGEGEPGHPDLRFHPGRLGHSRSGVAERGRLVHRPSAEPGPLHAASRARARRRRKGACPRLPRDRREHHERPAGAAHRRRGVAALAREAGRPPAVVHRHDRPHAHPLRLRGAGARLRAPVPRARDDAAGALPRRVRPRACVSR